jgi:hypothetical protein
VGIAHTTDFDYFNPTKPNITGFHNFNPAYKKSAIAILGWRSPNEPIVVTTIRLTPLPLGLVLLNKQ